MGCLDAVEPLVEVGGYLQRAGYRFVTPTPLTHALERVLGGQSRLLLPGKVLVHERGVDEAGTNRIDANTVAGVWQWIEP